MQVEKRGAPSAEISNTCWKKKKKETKRKKGIMNDMITLLSTAHLQDFLPAPKSLFIMWMGRN